MDILSTLVEWALHFNDLLPVLLETHRWWALLLLFWIIMVETSLFPPLPGDSLVFAAGLAAAGAFINVHLVVVTLTGATVAGYLLSYLLGWRLSLYVLRGTRLISLARLDQTKAFFSRHGRWAVVAGRFVPGLRTAVPIAAGLAGMPFRSFVLFSTLGGVAWVSMFAYAGYFLGTIPAVRDNLFFVTLGVFVFSLTPLLVRLLGRTLRKRLLRADGPDVAVSSTSL